MSRASSARAARSTESTIGLGTADTNKLIQAIEQGLPMRVLEALAMGLGMPMAELAGHLGVPARTLARRKAAGRLSPDESERVVRVARLFEKTLALFDWHAAEARQWLRSAKQGLGGKTPLDYARTEIGAREVENLLGRIEHGVFS